MIDLAPDLTVEAVPGWFNHGNQILELLELHRPMVIVELGSWLGASAIGMARLVRRWGGTVTCVDTWQGTVTSDLTQTMAPWMLVACARHVMAAGLGGHIRLVPASTHEAGAAWVQRSIDALYIDADHSADGVADDLATWVPLLRPGALLLGDDYGNRLFPGVAQAWDAFESRNGYQFTRYQSDPPLPDGTQLIYGTV